MRWEDMVKLEPRLGTIMQAARKDRSGNADQRYECYKREISELVGYAARLDALRNQTAYETTIRRLTTVLG